MHSTIRNSFVAALLLAAGLPAAAQDEVPSRENRMFGMEFEFAGNGNRIVSFEEMPWENYEKLMRKIVEHYGGNPNEIKRVDFEKETSNLERYPSGKRKLFRAEYKDPRGRTWLIEPEFVASSGYDGYELVTPPMTDPKELKEVLTKIKSSGLVREGLKSGVHLTIDGRGLVKSNGDAKALANLIMLHENSEPMLRRMFNPVRGGGHANRFSRSIAVDHEDLLKEIDRLRPEERTRAKLEAMFKAREAKEATLHGADPMDPNSWSKLWKYRSMNLAKVLNINSHHDGNKGVVEFRMFDLHALENPDIHRLEAKLYRAMVAKATEMAKNGETVKYTPRATQPAGENPGVFNTPDKPTEAKAKAREMIERLGLDPVEFEPLLEKNVARHRDLRTPSEFKGVLDALPKGRVEHNGKAFTYGFELEGTGEGFARIARPKDAETNARWDTMTDAEKYAYFREKVGSNRNAVKTHFELDLQKFPWLDPSWKVEGSGNWEVRSKVFESIEEATKRMREVKSLTGKSGKGFHLHMRDNGTDWEMLKTKGSEFADFIERSSNWVWLERARRLGTMTSMKSWSNARMKTSVLNSLANMTPDNFERATVRVQVPSSKDYIDLEIRGFTKNVDEIETLAKIYTDGLKTGNFGPWKHSDNPLAMDGQGNAPKSLRFVEHYEKYLKEVEGRTMTPEERKVIDGLQHEYGEKAKGRARTYATNVATPLLPWEAEASLDEAMRRELKFKKYEYLRSLRFTANKIMDGEYGLDLSVASEKGLIKHLAVSEAEAKALVEFRRNGGKLETSEDVARALARGADAGKMSLLNSVDLEKADAKTLTERLGIAADKVDNVVNLRDKIDVLDALKKAGVSEANVLSMIDKSAGLDLASNAATAEKIAAVTGLSEDAAKKIIAYRDANEINGLEDLKKAGLSETDANKVLGLANKALDLKTATDAELKGIGLTDTEIEELKDARGGKKFEKYADVTAAGVSNEVATKLKNARGINLAKLNTLDAEEISRLGRISLEDAKKIVAHRGGKNLADVEVLRDIFSYNRATEIHKAANKVDLASASEAELKARGVDAELAKKLVNFRDAHKIGRGNSSYNWESYKASKAAEELKSAGILSEADSEKVRNTTDEVKLETADRETLKKRFGLSEELAERVTFLRDPHKLDLEGLKKAGLSEAEAKKVLEAATALDPKKASLKELAERTGLSTDRLLGLLKVDGVDLMTASEADLAKRLGITTAEAAKLVAARQNGNRLDSVEKLVEAGLSEASAKKAHKLAKGVNLGTATVEELKSILGEAEARKLAAARDKAKAAEGVNADEIARQVRFKVKKWAKETGLSEALLRSLLPRPNPANTTVTSGNPTEAPGEGFGRTRRGSGKFAESKVSYETVSSIFEAIREGTAARLSERVGETNDAEIKKALERGAANAKKLKLEIVETNDILAEHKDGRLRVSTGLFNEIYARGLKAVEPGARTAFRARVLGLIMGHEAAHSAGIKAERVADAEGLKILEKSSLGLTGDVNSTEIKEAVKVFEKPTGASHIDNFFARLRNLIKYGTVRGRVRNLERTARGETDPLKKYRRADGTLKWKELTKDRAIRESLGLAHFGLALFLKEVATVAATGDRARIEEFFDGLMTTDFYKHYGLFVAGARVAEIGYARYLQRYIKPRFVNGLLKTNMVLAAGMALPMIVEGTFEGKAFAISLASLGLSSTAVSTGMRGIKWVMDLKKAKQTGTLARVGVGASRFAKVGGWFYTVAELAVVLYFAEKIESSVNAWLDLKAARAELAKAGTEFVKATSDPKATEKSIAAAADKYHEAWVKYRNFLYGPLHVDEALLAARLEKVAKRAKIKADERKTAIDNLNKHASLRRNIERRYGSVEKYADALVRKSEKEIEAEVNKYVSSYNLNREKHLKEVYESNKRGTPILGDVENLDWLLAGGKRGASGDPYNGRTDTFANWGRDRARSSLEDAFKGASKNRVEAYDDERAIMARVIAALRDAGKGELADVLEKKRDLVGILKVADENLIKGDGLIDTKAKSGMADRLKRIAGDGN